MKKLVIFDLDGTILDTLDDLMNSLNAALRKRGCPQRSREEVRSFVGNGIGKLIERALQDGQEEAFAGVYRDFMDHYRVHSADFTRPYPGILELLTELHRRKYRIAVVSNKADAVVKALCARYFPDMIDLAVGEREGVRRKPAPDAVLELMDQLGMSAGETIYVGDSEVDVETAKNAGIDLVAVSWGFREAAFLRDRGACLLADRAEDLQRLILDFDR